MFYTKGKYPFGISKLRLRGRNLRALFTETRHIDTVMSFVFPYKAFLAICMSFTYCG